MPRSITATASQYQRNRIWSGEFVRGESFQLGLNLGGVLASGVTISSIVWRVLATSSVILGAGTTSARSATVTCTAGIGPGGVVKAVATASDGKVWSQLYRVTVEDAPWFTGEVAPAAGSATVTA